ncbi:CTB family bacteriocin, partial [Tolypothrix sp. FACHB-123]
MSHEIKNVVAVELSEQELDNVAGGLALVLGDVNG